MTNGAYQTWNEGARIAAVARAERWTAAQAQRLNTTPAVILTAIRDGGWLAEQIERVESRYQLESVPPALAGVPDWVEARIAAVVKAKARAERAPTVMAEALKQVRAA